MSSLAKFGWNSSAASQLMIISIPLKRFSLLVSIALSVESFIGDSGITTMLAVKDMDQTTSTYYRMGLWSTWSEAMPRSFHAQHKMWRVVHSSRNTSKEKCLLQECELMKCSVVSWVAEFQHCLCHHPPHSRHHQLHTDPLVLYFCFTHPCCQQDHQYCCLLLAHPVRRGYELQPKLSTT